MVVEVNWKYDPFNYQFVILSSILLIPKLLCMWDSSGLQDGQAIVTFDTSYHVSQVADAGAGGEDAAGSDAAAGGTGGEPVGGEADAGSAGGDAAGGAADGGASAE